MRPRTQSSLDHNKRLSLPTQSCLGPSWHIVPLEVEYAYPTIMVMLEVVTKRRMVRSKSMEYFLIDIDRYLAIMESD